MITNSLTSGVMVVTCNMIIASVLIVITYKLIDYLVPGVIAVTRDLS